MCVQGGEDAAVGLLTVSHVRTTGRARVVFRSLEREGCVRDFPGLHGRLTEANAAHSSAVV